MPRLEPGSPAPPFALANQDGSTVALSDFAGRRLIVFFYPAAMTPGCTTEACDFQDALSPLQAAGYALLGVSPDPPVKLAIFAEKETLRYPLLSDPDRSVLKAYGAYGEKSMYGKTVTGVIRSSVVIDEAGHIVLAKYNVRAKGHVAALATSLGVSLPAAG
ncbi:MAG TPA: thioredoxin-dependent thiol peroxidase [Dermatophilaceae bacterium]|nr:thioredoxin-dependent thiol peroxidase [Dermatophilaceae bacterium]